MKIRCRRCYFCGKEMGNIDFQFWIRKPKVRFGYPEYGMPNYDICDDCFAELKVLLLERKKQKERQEDE